VPKKRNKKTYANVIPDLEQYGIAAEPEYKFCSSRKWRFDFAIPSHKIAVEIEGGIWTGGRHTRGQGFIDDMEKYNEAAILGWRVLRFQPKEADNGALRSTVYRAVYGV